MSSLQGHLLVASPRLPDENFYHTVVLMIQHTGEGAFGVVLNRPSGVTVGEVWQKVSETPCDSEVPVNVGGPVEGPLIAVHTEPTCSENEVLPGVYVATQKDFLDSVVTQKGRPFRVFSGYAGWAGGQLEGELKMGGWLTMPATSDLIFGREEDLWRAVTRAIGQDVLRGVFKDRKLPDDPSVN
jgi:putative transcriptional regulator